MASTASFSIKLRLLASVLLMMAVSACTRSQMSGGMQGDTLRLCYSDLLTIVERVDSVCIVRVADPWKEGRALNTYALVPRTMADVPSDLPERCCVVRVPLQKAVVFTAIHSALVAEFGMLDRMAGVCDARYILLDEIHRRLADGRLKDFGNSMSPTVETLIAAAPDALLMSPFENGGYGQAEKLGIPIVECADYMETSALGRAEWMKFYGRLFGVDADSIFLQVEESYNALRRESVGRSLLSDQLNGQAWYMPGGKSYLGRLFADAGADYVFAGREETGSIALSFETVFAAGRDADIWLLRYNSPTDMTYSQLAQGNGLYREFKAFRQRQVFACNTGRAIYYEETCFHPERLLKDIEDVLDGRPAKYFKPLVE